jgi:uncharacterized protein (UPF0335 family)
MIDRIFKIFQRLISSAERDRLDRKFDKGFSDLDDRIDRLEVGQAEIKGDIKAIREITSANNETLESKINRSTVTSESVRQIVDARIDGFQGGMKRLEDLLNQIIRRDCNLP